MSIPTTESMINIIDACKQYIGKIVRDKCTGYVGTVIDIKIYIGYINVTVLRSNARPHDHDFDGKEFNIHRVHLLHDVRTDKYDIGSIERDYKLLENSNIVLGTFVRDCITNTHGTIVSITISASGIRCYINENCSEQGVLAKGLTLPLARLRKCERKCSKDFTNIPTIVDNDPDLDNALSISQHMMFLMGMSHE